MGFVGILCLVMMTCWGFRDQSGEHVGLILYSGIRYVRVALIPFTETKGG